MESVSALALDFLEAKPLKNKYILLNLLVYAGAESLQSCPTLCDPIDRGPLSLGLSRQEHWSGLPFPSPVHESEKQK